MDLNPNFTNLKSKQDISFLSRSGYQVMAIRFEKTKFKVWGNCYLKPYLLCSQPLSKSIRSSNLSFGHHLFFLSSHYIFLPFVYTLFCLCSSFSFWCVKNMRVILSKMSLWIFNFIPLVKRLFIIKLLNFVIQAVITILNIWWILFPRIFRRVRSNLKNWYPCWIS